MSQESGATWGALRRAFVVAPALRKGLGLTLVLTAIGTALRIVVPFAVQQILDGQLFQDAPIDGGAILLKGGIAGFAMVVSALAARAATIRLTRSAAAGLSDLRVMTFAHLQGLSALHTESERRGALVARITSDPETIARFMEWGGPGLIVGSAQIVLAVGAMMWFDWRLTMVVLVGVGIYAVALLWFQNILRRAHDKVRILVGKSLTAVGESISGLPVIRAFGVEAETADRVRTALDAQFDAEYRTGRLGAFLFSSAEVFAGAINGLVVVVGVALGTQGSLSAGTLVAFLFLINLFVEPIQMLVEVIDQAQSAGSGLRRILGVLDTPSDVPEVSPRDAIVLPEDMLDVSFDGVRFRYPDGEADVLVDVSVCISKGENVAVVGETGSGKTTFAKLVTRLMDTSAGSVRLGGVPVRAIQFADLRSRIAYVPQEGFLFDTTIEANVRYGKLSATRGEIRNAFAELGLTTWIDSLVDGLATEVGERGSQLSAGERQLVALTRAWIAQPSLLVLDEATSAVDPALDVQLRQAMERITRSRTSVTIAHRLSTAEAADRVLVFADGVLVEDGDHTTLLEQQGVYALMHEDWARGTTG
ncbi:Heterodimeric efflux ABC transporter, permease/ATP-binding subunit 2 [hydrothermal vent metagenome]|uniref:Heterodimeric efflux ABC transporter, permease/ATP-binding subunit 2 n=1 Tax=hydrothermal vent metagenome TaxID=652676 RepID=A0A3B0SD09_9ZZZZ